jgi:hypothetical protein
MSHNRYVVIFNSVVVAVTTGESFESSGYTGQFLLDYDTVVLDNEEKWSLGQTYEMSPVVGDVSRFEHPANRLLRVAPVEVLP